jgi:hypothetical protein
VLGHASVAVTERHYSFMRREDIAPKMRAVMEPTEPPTKRQKRPSRRSANGERSHPTDRRSCRRCAITRRQHTSMLYRRQHGWKTRYGVCYYVTSTDSFARTGRIFSDASAPRTLASIVSPLPPNQNQTAPRRAMKPARRCRLATSLILRGCSSGAFLLLPGVREQRVH